MLVSRGGGFGESPAVAGAAFLGTAVWLGGGAGSARHESPFDHLQVAVRGMLEDRRSQAVADRRNLAQALVLDAVLVANLGHLAGRALDPPAAGMQHVLAIRFEHGLDQRHPSTRPNRPSADRDLPDGDRTKDV